MLKKFEPQIKAGLTQDDYGFGVSNGCEIIIHELQTRFHSSVPLWSAETDFENAYNALARALIFHVASIYCPDLIPFLIFRYSNMIVLFRDKHGTVFILSTTGVSQGCPLSSALFQLAMSFILQPIRAEYPDCVILSFQDDNVLTSDCPVKLDRMFSLLEEASLTWGLHFNFSKMWLLSNQPFPADFPARFPTLAKMALTNDGIKILGGFVGTDAFVHQQLVSALSKTRGFYSRVHTLIDHARFSHPNAEFTQLLLNFLRYCCPSKASYLLRVTDSRRAQPFLLPLDIDKAVAALLISLADPKSAVFRTPTEFRLLCEFIQSNAPNDLRSEGSVIFTRIFLPVGGAGFMSSLSTSTVAFLASISATAPYIQRDLNRTSTIPRNGAVILNLAPVEAALLSTALPHERASLAAILPSYQPHAARLGVQTLLSQFAKSSLQANVDTALLLLSQTGMLHNPSRYPKWLSMAHPAASLWSRAPRTNFDFQLTNEQASDAILMSLGIPPFLPPVCSICQCAIPTNAIEEHAFSSCGRPAQSPSGSITEKAVGAAAKRVGITVSQPQTRCRALPGWLPTAYNLSSDKHTEHKADWLFTTALTSSAVDITYTGRFSPDPRNATSRLFAARARVREKYAKYSKLYVYPDGALIPLAMEAHGALDDRLYNMLLEAHNGDHGDSYDQASLHYGLTSISVALRKTCTLHFNCVRYHTRSSPTTMSSPSSN
jgi:hypothetical protein